MRSFNRFLLCTTLLALSTCKQPDPEAGICESYRSNHFENQFQGKYHYDVHPDTVTPEGVHVDDSGITGLDLATLLDAQTDEVEQCLEAAFGNPPVIPPEDIGRNPNFTGSKSGMDCSSSTFSLPIERGCLTVKVADNWLCSAGGGVSELYGGAQELLPVPGPAAGCIAKGECLEADGVTPVPNCPCYWRVGIQDNSVIVVTPTFYLYKDALIRMITGCNVPWKGKLAKCAQASVHPLPAGQTMCVPPMVK